MKFKTAGAADIRIVLLSGHTTYVTGEWAELAERFHPEAYAKGCLSEVSVKNQALADVPADVVEDVAKKSRRKQTIQEAVFKVLGEGDSDKTTSSNKPTMDVLTKLTKLKVSQLERDVACTAFNTRKDG